MCHQSKRHRSFENLSSAIIVHQVVVLCGDGCTPTAQLAFSNDVYDGKAQQEALSPVYLLRPSLSEAGSPVKIACGGSVQCNE